MKLNTLNTVLVLRTWPAAVGGGGVLSVAPRMTPGTWEMLMLTCIARGVRTGRGWPRTGNGCRMEAFGPCSGFAQMIPGAHFYKGKPTTHWVQKEGVMLTTFCFFSSGKHYDFRLWGFCYNIRHRKPWQLKLPYSIRWSGWPGQAVSDRTLCFVPVVWSLSTGRPASRSATKKSTCAAGDLRGARTPALPFSRLLLCLWTPCHGYTSHFLKIS